MPQLRRVALRCDASPTLGVGHVVRCLALAEELQARGIEVLLLGDLGGVEWVEQLYAERGIRQVAAPERAHELADLAVQLTVDAVVLDGYGLPPQCGVQLRARKITVLAIVDYQFGAGQSADLYVDQNLGAEPAAGQDPGGFLAGLDYALFRDSVLQHRRGLPLTTRSPPRVLAVFGGTDPFGASPTIVPLLLATGAPVHLIAVAARAELGEALRSLPTESGQQVEVVPPARNLPAIAVGCDLVISAAGSSIWEMLCLGVPCAVVCVVDNQRDGYRRIVASALAAPIGLLAELREQPRARHIAIDRLRVLLSDAPLRAQLARSGQLAVDGQGRARVVDALAARHRALNS
ncbi:PseG/SpsG family protein [Leekyejoonella antrihumi]|uniref:Spore coat protein n=1 Tax=Leekyejoonella antrihumi TaxID=1660198 RepID=A0A563DYM5_9MICO|nr:spore coat protein [Leekyejoonella antrihumi]TWP35072.1 spore coat protein [Leekyejoonella antrihumi]